MTTRPFDDEDDKNNENVIGYIPEGIFEDQIPVLTAEQLEAIRLIEEAEDDIDDEIIEKLTGI